MRERKDHFFGTTRAPRHVHELDLTVVVTNPDQPRKHFDEEKLRELAASIERQGLLQPILVQRLPGEGGRYMIVAGERRFRAHQLLGRATIDAIIYDGMPDRDELALIENVQRENLNPVEEAEALAALQEKHGYTQEQLAEVVGKSRVAVTETLRLTSLAASIKAECLTSDRVPKAVLIEIARAGDEAAQLSFWEQIKRGDRSVRAVRERRQARRGKSERARQSEVAQAITFGRSFVKRIVHIPDEYLAANQAEYAALMALARQIATRLEAARQSIGEPVEVTPDTAEPVEAE